MTFEWIIRFYCSFDINQAANHVFQSHDRIQRHSNNRTLMCIKKVELTCACVVFDTTGAAILYETKLLLRISVINTTVTPAIDDSRLDCTTDILLGIILCDLCIYGFVMLFWEAIVFLFSFRQEKLRHHWNDD